MAKHTDTPWEARKPSDDGTAMISAPPHAPKMKDNFGITFRRICLFEPSPYMTKAQCKANAEFVVMACNSHEAMLAALRMVLDDPGLTASANDVIRGAIELAEGAK